MLMTLYCAMPASSNAINALLTDTTYLNKWSDNIDDNKNYYSILSNNSSNTTKSSGNSNCQQSRTFSGFHTSVNFQH